MKKLVYLLLCLFMATGLSVAQTTRVSGTVLHAENDEPILGASVTVKGTGIGISTDTEGRFTLNIPTNVKTVHVSFLGAISQDVPVSSNMVIRLEPSQAALDEVVVFGYGTARKLGSVVGSVATVSSEALKKNPSPNFTDALQGQVAGLSVLSGSGEPIQNATMRLRGVNSITAGNTPLFILDGSPISSNMFNSLNPADITNITVLKDASSTAMYGSRAANGVIVLTSRKGKMGEKARVNLRAQYGFSSMITNKLDMMNSAQYIDFRELIGSPLPAEDVKIVRDNNIDTDWIDHIFRNDAPTYQVDLSITGGSENINYYLSLNHTEKDGIAPLSTLRRESLRANLDARVNQWFKVGLNSNFGFQKYNYNPESDTSGGLYGFNPSFFGARALPIDATRYYTLDDNGKAVYGDRADFLHYTKVLNPLLGSELRAIDRTNVTANVTLNEVITPIKGLTIEAKQSMEARDYRSSVFEHPLEDHYSPMGDFVQYNSGAGYRSESFTRYYRFTYTHTAEYKRSFNLDHNMSVLLGQESEVSKNHSFGISRDGHTDSRNSLLTHGTEVPNNPSHSIVEESRNSYFVIGDYNYQEKYFFNGLFRREASSLFAPDGRWGNFWALGAKWDIKKESFMPQLDWLDGLSLRASIGATGNSSIDNYLFYGLASGSNLVYNGESGMTVSQASNYDLTWETVTATNIALDFRLFDRVTVLAEFYKKKTSDMLMEIPFSYTTGFGGGYGNIGAMTNTGVELNVDVDILKAKDYLWTFRANVNYNKNEITELFNNKEEYVLSNTGLKLQIGKPYGEYYQVKYLGVDPRDGKQLWEDYQGNPTKVYNEDRDAQMSGKQRYAPWSGGFGTYFTWKGISVSGDFAWVLGKYATNNDRYFLSNPFKYGTSNNQTTDMLNLWTTPGQITDIPGVGEEIFFDSHLLENSSFLRLKNLNVGYDLPKNWVRKAGLTGVNVFFTGRNLFTVTNYTGYDPEPDTNVILFRYPNTKEFVFGAEITF